ncbi:MAG TPA: hypothetical protein VHF88_09650 [Thermoleophilaceae bacterium]|nr:hypothetical protein [Thermoleophilaceae bacterium]
MLRLSERLRTEQDGNLLVIAMTMMTLMMVTGFATLSIVDTQTDVAMKERQHESSFNLAEGVLNAQTYVLARRGTGDAGASQFPDACVNGTTHSLCPSEEQLARSYSAAVQVDYGDDTNWTTRVRDNPNGTFYDPTAVAAAARYDANGDRQLWVSAEATVRGRTRQIVALIRVEDRPVTFPSYALLGGMFATSNSGRGTIVDATDPSSLGIAVRCVGEPSKQSSCLKFDPKKDQLNPPKAYTTGVPDTAAISLDDLQALEEYARGSGTYYGSCPGPNPNGAVVVIESGDCPFSNSSPAAPGASKCCNTPTRPGLLIVKCGTVTLKGNIEFYGIIYMPQGDCSLTGYVVTTQGTSLISGGVIIDGMDRGLLAGSSGDNIVFNPLAFQNVRAAGTAGVVQNTWREVPDDL